MPLSSSRRGAVHKAAATRRQKVRTVSRIKVLRVLQHVMAATTATGTSDTPDAGATASTSSASATATTSTGAAADTHNEFYNTSRVGRRNALADILCQRHLQTGGAGTLADQLGAMSTGGDGAGCSSHDGDAGASTSGSQAASEAADSEAGKS